MKKISISVLSFLICSSSYAQLNKWYIRKNTPTFAGYVIIDFSQSTPSVFINNSITSNGMEDINVMTDNNNTVLFYTIASALTSTDHFITVRKANDQLMPNGNDLIGNTSTLESGIVRIPCTTNKYYMIHLNSITGNLYYSIIDMGLNGGEVVSKNIFLGTDHTEAITVSHQMENGCRWLITGKSIGNTYEVVKYLISQTGIGSPVTLAVVNFPDPTIHPQEMELSPDNSKLAMSTMQTSNNADDIVVWDFNLNTGDITNKKGYKIIDVPHILGIEFSPDNSKIYFRSNTLLSPASSLGRVDLVTEAVDIIDGSMGILGTQIEAAGNGKIYITRYAEEYLSVIADPNNTNIANIGFAKNGLLITDGTNSHDIRVGIPNAIDGEPPGTTTTPEFADFDVVIQSVGCNTYKFIDKTCLATSWEWDFGDGNTSTDQSPTHQYAANGIYTISLTVTACGQLVTETKTNFVNANGCCDETQ